MPDRVETTITTTTCNSKFEWILLYPMKA